MRLPTKLLMVRRAFTMVELLAVVAIIGVMIGLLLPAVQSARESARRRSCVNNMMQTGIAVQSYHHSFNQFPVQLSGTDGSTVVGADNDRRLSIFVAILPYLGDRSTSEKIAATMSHANDVDGQMSWDMGMDMMDIEEADEQAIADYEADTNGESTKTTSSKKNAKPPWPAGGPEPFETKYWPWMYEAPTLRCPSDPGVGLPSMGRTNYAACMGDGLVAINTGPMKSTMGTFVVAPALQKQTEVSMRGVFVPRTRTRIKDVTDGQSNTIMLGEISTDLGDRNVTTTPVVGPGEAILRDQPRWAYTSSNIDEDRPEYWVVSAATVTPAAGVGLGNTIGRGFRWADGMPIFTGINTVLPPNSVIVASVNRDDASGYFPPSSRHQGGANVCFVDGSIRFITDSVDAGNQSAPTHYFGSPTQGKSSPFGVWGAMGTRSSRELVFVDSEVGI